VGKGVQVPVGVGVAVFVAVGEGWTRRTLARASKKGVTPGGITPIRRFRTTLLPAAGPPLPLTTTPSWPNRQG
jgi:hypothetical protein